MAISVLVAVIVSAVAVGAYYALNLGASHQTTTSETSSSANNNDLCTHRANYQQFNGCASPMSYSTLNQLIQNPNNSFVNNGNGTVFLSVGHNACTTWFYFLPNQTNVIEYLGTTGNQTCV